MGLQDVLAWVGTMRPYRHGTVASETERSGVYDQPGLELGCGIALPLVTLTALVGGIVVAVTDAPLAGLIAGFVALVVGVLAWIGLWELFVRLHPRFSQGRGSDLKFAVVLLGPAIVTLAAVMLVADQLRPR